MCDCTFKPDQKIKVLEMLMKQASEHRDSYVKCYGKVGDAIPPSLQSTIDKLFPKGIS